MVGVTGFEPAASTSQTSRATNCATPRSVKNIEFLRFFCKWSNLWSNHLQWDFCERGQCRKSQCLQGLSAFSASRYLWGGVLLPKHARYQLRYIPKSYFYCQLLYYIKECNDCQVNLHIKSQFLINIC